MAFFKDIITDLNGIMKDLGKIGVIVMILAFFFYGIYQMFLKDRMEE